MVDDEGRLRPAYEALGHEMETGWLAAVAAGEGATEEAVGA
jgi:hypothetical protein